MRTLAIECATEACSIALFDRDLLLAHDHRVLGRGHAERLIPMIAALPDNGRAAEIRVSLGPGSFTGVRVGLAAARALGIAWGAAVRGYPTLALVATAARQTYPEAVTVCMTGGHGQWFIQDFGADGLPETKLCSIPKDEAHECGNHRVIAGSQASAKSASHASDHVILDILPDARQAIELPGALLSDQLTPIYGRAPDAKLPK